MFRDLIFKPALILFLLLPNFCPGQQLLYQFRQYTANDGLPSSEVHQVLKDSRNFMWFATDHGVCRYDGYNFETYNLSDNSILSLYEDSKKRIWAASFSGQLFYYENGKFYDYKYNDLVVRAIDQLAINRFYVDSMNNVFVSTTAPDCFMIDRNGNLKELFQPNINCTFEVFENDIGGFFSYTSGCFIEKGKLLIGGGLKHTSIISIKSKKRTYEIKFPIVISGRKTGSLKLSDSNIVFYGSYYLFRILPNGKYVSKKFQNNILDVKEYNSNELLVATIQDGLYSINEKSELIQQYFSGLTVTSIEKDYEGGIWISTTQAGVFYLNSMQMKHLADNGQIISSKILCLETDSNSGFWAGEEGGNVLHFSSKQNLTFYDFPVISINGIHCGVLPNTILICAGDFISKDVHHLLAYNYSGNKFVIAQGISDIIPLGNHLLSGVTGGITVLDIHKLNNYRLNNNFFRVSSLFRDHSNNILVGNVLGLWKFINDTLQLYDSSNAVLRSRITDINEYKDQFLLLGTRGKGLLILKNDSLRQLTFNDGLASDNIRKIFIDENIIWLATNKGISRLEFQSFNPFKYSIQNISVQDGLLSNEVNDIKRLDSNIIAATNGGISVFSRNLYAQRNGLPVPIYITGAKINNLDTGIYDHYDLYRSSRNFSISYVGLSYRKSSNIEYRYRLLGIDSNWVYTAARQIQFNPIPYGRYTVQIEARRQGEEWNDSNTASLSIDCRAPFWKTIWFWITTFLLVAVAMLLFFINRTRKIRQRERDRTALNKKLAEMELKALRAQMNPHFIFNILNSIQYFIIHNENEEAQIYMSKFAKLVRLTLDNSRSTFISLADELSLLKLYIDLEKIRFEDRFDYRIDVDDDVNINSIKIPNMLLQPYVENSIKHGFKSRQTKYFLNISVSKKDDKITCTITDNGIGREKAALISSTELEKHASTGTIIVEEKIEALKFYYNYNLGTHTEDLKDEKGNAAGTRVSLIFPEQFDPTDML
ncbi:MAG TPA: histidine kinase [Chitinophagaceae bacterium]|nr:histidine kinase [Chitinophagaceae bacterium]